MQTAVPTVYPVPTMEAGRGWFSSVPRIREARFEDHGQLVDLAERHSLNFEPLAAWKHLWTENPVYNALEGEWPIGWVLQNEAGDIVGYLGNIPLNYYFRGERLLVATGRCWVVDQHYRSYSVLLMAEHFSQKGVDLFINATLKKIAVDAYSSFGTRRVPAGRWDRAVFWVTDPRGFAESVLASRNARHPRLLSLPLSAAILLANKRRPAFKSHSKFQLDIAEGFNDDFDVFWQELKLRYPDRLLAEHSKIALQWHFKHVLAEKRAWIVTAKDGSRIVAYAVFMRFDNERIGLKRVRLTDFQELETGALPAMMSWALGCCRREGIHVLENIGVQNYSAISLEDHAPFARQLPNWMFQYKADKKGLSEALLDPAAWNPSSFDGDGSLY
ncbi:MAG: hypothetical protein JWO91_1122 [Acidobacteriaceae bacterium]|nr:hypothetical protein [Acidobacteriaceae bacterium]